MAAKNALIPVVQGLVDAVTFSVAIAALAYAGTGRAASPFETLDRNADQRLSRSEASYDRKLSELFAYMDRDGDGFLSPVEYAEGERSEAASTASAATLGSAP